MPAATETETIQFSCEKCQKVIRTPASFAGKAGKCPGCKKAVRAPENARVRRATPASAPVAPEPAPAPKKVARDEREHVNMPKLMGGITAMVIAVVWFVVGLMGGIIFIYPPILFCLGLGGVIKAVVERPAAAPQPA